MDAMADEKRQLMALALELAARGVGLVEPNPMVGAVIARGGEELSRGWHGRFGGPHAEREALSAAERAGRDVRGATLYVTLEPCCHHGKTPPCTEAIIAAGLSRVVVAMTDPDENVSGRGIEALRAAGIEVEVGVCEAEARSLLAAYVKLRTLGRPWVICKWAQTSDGYLALPPGQGRWITGESARRKVHELRGLCDGICVGINTVLADDPLLTNRSGTGRRPVRLVLDSRLRIPESCRLLATADESQPVIVATVRPARGSAAARAAALRRPGVEVLELPAAESGRVALEALLDELGRRQWTRLLVEGGAAVLRRVVLSGLADELWAFVSPDGAPAAGGGLPRFDLAELRRKLTLDSLGEERFGGDVLLRFRLT